MGPTNATRQRKKLTHAEIRGVDLPSAAQPPRGGPSKIAAVGSDCTSVRHDLWHIVKLGRLRVRENGELRQKTQNKAVFFAPSGHGIAITGEIRFGQTLPFGDRDVVKRKTRLGDQAPAFTA